MAGPKFPRKEDIESLRESLKDRRLARMALAIRKSETLTTAEKREAITKLLKKHGKARIKVK